MSMHKLYFGFIQKIEWGNYNIITITIYIVYYIEWGNYSENIIVIIYFFKHFKFTILRAHLRPENIFFSSSK